MPSKSNSLFQSFFLVLLTIFAFFLHLGAFEPDIMEARNFITAREILENNQWLLPTMNGLPRLEKPPFPTWFTAFLMNIFGDSLFWLRLPAALMGSIMVYFTYRISRLPFQDSERAFMSAIVLLTIPMVLIMGRTGSWDIFCIATALGACYYFLRFILEQSPHWKFAALSGLFIGLSAMSKGPVGIFALFIPFLIGVFFAFPSGVKRLRGWNFFTFLLIAMVVSTWWYIYAAFQAPLASTEIAGKEVEAWTNRHNQPFYFYLAFPLYTGMWLSIVAYGFFFRRNRQQDEKHSPYLFLFVWMAAALILLSIVPEKKERYLLPVYPPTAILVAYLLNKILLQLEQQKKAAQLERMVFKFFNFLLLAALASAPVITLLLFVKTGHLPLDSWMIYCAITSVLVFLAFQHTLKKQFRKLIYIIGFSTMNILFFIYPVLPSYVYKNPDFKDITEIQKTEWYHEYPFYTNHELNPKAIWRIGKVVKEVKSIDELPLKPFVLISDKEITSIWGSEWVSRHRIVNRGSFDYFRKKSNYKLYVKEIHPQP